MKISVIITAKDDRGWLQQAINSAKEQEFYGYEIILASDGNPFLEAFADMNGIGFALLPKQKNLAANFNNAVKMAKGKYLKILADDDILLPDTLSALYDRAEQQMADMVFGDFQTIDTSGFVTGFYKTPVLGYPSINELIRNKKIAAGCTLINKASFLEVGGLDSRFNIAEFYILWLKFLKAKMYNFYYLDKFICQYRHHSGQKSMYLSEKMAAKRADEMVRINKKYAVQNSVVV